MAPSGGTTNATVKFTGFAGLGLYGGGTYAINCAMTSKGDIDVSGGTLEFLSNGSWLNGTNVAVRGTGTLKIASANTLNGNAIVAADTTEGAKISVADGVQQVVGELFVNGVQMRRGVYGGANAPVPPDRRLDCFDSTATGTFRVAHGRPIGTQFIFR